MKIFIAYAHQDRTVVRSLADSLKAAGHEVWIDIGGIAGGSNWLEEIEQMVLRADLIIVLISEASNSSSWVKRELLYALEIGKPVLPVRIEPVLLPLLLANLQFVDISNDTSSGLRQVIDLLEQKSVDFTTIEEVPLSPEQIAHEREQLLEEPLTDRIFIAYSRKQRSLAREIATMLSKKGKAIFYDAHIRAGARWRKIIQKALDDATHVVVIWTPEARDSDEVEREVSYALAEGKVIIPILSKEIPKLPYHLHGLQYLILQEELALIEQELFSAMERFSEDEAIWQ